MANISLVHEFIIKEKNHSYVVIHGHAFDSITSRLTFLAKLGDVAYNLLLKFNNVWNKARQKRGKEYYSLSAVVKHKVKQAVSAISGLSLIWLRLPRPRGATALSAVISIILKTRCSRVVSIT